MGKLSESTVKYLNTINQPVQEVVAVQYTKGGGTSKTSVVIRVGQDKEKRIRQVIGYGVEYNVLECDVVVEHVEQDLNSQGAINEEMMRTNLEGESNISDQGEEVIKPVVKKRGRPRKRT